jgi:hypothetical protein
MTRGHGYVQRFLLAQLDEQALADVPGLWLHVYPLAERLVGGKPTTAQLESVRRAVRILAAAGAVEIEPNGVSSFQAADWPDHLRGGSRARLVARIPLEKRAEAAERRALRDDEHEERD